MVGNNTSLASGLVAALVLFVLNFILKKILFKYTKLSALIQQKPEVLIHNGTLDFKLLSKLNISSEELREAMREHGVEHFSDVKLSMLEIDGNISIITGTNNLKQTHYKRLKKLKKTIY